VSNLEKIVRILECDSRVELSKIGGKGRERDTNVLDIIRFTF
jgi:hypothetical protein